MAAIPSQLTLNRGQRGILQPPKKRAYDHDFVPDTMGADSWLCAVCHRYHDLDLPYEAEDADTRSE